MKYGCWNRPDQFKPKYFAPARRYFPDGSFEMISEAVTFVNNHECHSDGTNGLGLADQGCIGCRHIMKENQHDRT